MSEPYSERAHKEILVESWSNSARTLLLRGHATGGPFAEQHTTNADRSRAESTYEIHGMPEGLTVSPLSAGVRRGECYVRVTLMMDGEPVERLIAAYLTDGKTLSWPPGVHEGFTEGPGLVRMIVGTNPAAGGDTSESVPTNARWKILSWIVTLVCDANVADRSAFLILDDGTNQLMTKLSWSTVAAGETTRFMAGPGLDVIATGNRRAQPIPNETILFQAYRIKTGTVNIQVGDDYGAPVFMVEEWIEE